MVMLYCEASDEYNHCELESTGVNKPIQDGGEAKAALWPNWD